MLVKTASSIGLAIWGTVMFGYSTSVYALPWELYADAASDSVCDVVNAANLELVVLEATGELVAITGTDVVFLDTFVDLDGSVFFLGGPAGFIEFAEDGDGFRTLWWLTILGDVAHVDLFTGEPLLSGLLPIDFIDVPCDACSLLNAPEECFDSDLDGIEDAFDFCDFTPLDEFPDSLGCSCSQLDSDADGVDNCFDLCPETPLAFVADFDGCACEELDDDFDGVNDCFDLCPGTLVALPDFDGCSCDQLDDDGDGVDNCFDLCPGTSPIAAVDFDGCAITAPPGDGTVINICGSLGAIMLPAMLCGLVGFRSGVRRHSG